MSPQTLQKLGILALFFLVYLQRIQKNKKKKNSQKEKNKKKLLNEQHLEGITSEEPCLLKSGKEREGGTSKLCRD